jgi:DNA-binding IclR family transcriptional regulator
MLWTFRGPEEWVRNAELSRSAHLSEAAGHRLVRTLEEVGVVVRNQRGCYRLCTLLANAFQESMSSGWCAPPRKTLSPNCERHESVPHVGGPG